MKKLQQKITNFKSKAISRSEIVEIQKNVWDKSCRKFNFKGDEIFSDRR